MLRGITISHRTRNWHAAVGRDFSIPFAPTATASDRDLRTGRRRQGANPPFSSSAAIHHRGPWEISYEESFAGLMVCEAVRKSKALWEPRRDVLQSRHLPTQDRGGRREARYRACRDIRVPRSLQTSPTRQSSIASAKTARSEWRRHTTGSTPTAIPARQLRHLPATLQPLARLAVRFGSADEKLARTLEPSIPRSWTSGAAAGWSWQALIWTRSSRLAASGNASSPLVVYPGPTMSGQPTERCPGRPLAAVGWRAAYDLSTALPPSSGSRRMSR